MFQCGQLKLFGAKHHWLIVASSINVTEKFNNVVLNINADIHLAVPSTPLNWTIIDIYNPASKHGGVLNCTEIGLYNEKEGYKFRNYEAIYWARKNMTGITFKSLVVVIRVVFS